MRYALTCHPDTPAASVRAVVAEFAMNDPNEMQLTFRVTPGEALARPEPAPPARTDGLWRRTCFEMFAKPQGAAGYVEFNLSPSGQWAAYAFDGYRAGMRDLPLPIAPQVEVAQQEAAFVLEGDIDLAALPPGPLMAGLSAVIEEVDGTKSYWALRHAPGAPDFHHADCFAIELPAASGA